MTRKRNSDNDLVVTGAGAVAPARRKAAARPRAKRAAEQATIPAAAQPETIAPQADAISRTDSPTYEQIAALAYSYWEARGCQGGSPEEDWLRAEQELLVRSDAAIA